MKRIKLLYILTAVAAMLVGVGLAHAEGFDFGSDPKGYIPNETAREETGGSEPLTECKVCKTLDQSALNDDTRWRPEMQGPDGGPVGSQ
ncbi:MAG TPA: hypothetical protein VFV50_07750 [Bdellovibrionales bacterium]|nr:hypothetical protein [Bdellovibrionales bacterium]